MTGRRLGDGRGQRRGIELVGQEAVRHQPRPDGVVDGNAPREEAAARGDVAARHLDPGRCERLERGLEPLDLGGGPGGVLGRLEVRPDAGQAAPPDAAIARAAATAPSTGTPPRPSPLSISSSTSSGGPPALAGGRGREQGPEQRRVAGRDRDAAPRAPRRRAPAARIEHRHPTIDAGVPQRHASSRVATHSPSAPASTSARATGIIPWP